MYLKCRVIEWGRERDHPFAGSQMVVRVGAGQELHPHIPHRWQEPKKLGQAH